MNHLGLNQIRASPPQLMGGLMVFVSLRAGPVRLA